MRTLVALVTYSGSLMSIPSTVGFCLQTANAVRQLLTIPPEKMYYVAEYDKR